MQIKHSLSLIITTALLITGNLVGAGILALPINTGLAGFVPSLACMLIVGAAMFFSAYILGHEAVNEKEKTFNYPSLYMAYLGKVGKWIAIFANLLILYGLLTAYLTGATTIVTSLVKLPVPKEVVMIGFFLLITWLTVAEMKVVRKYNALLMLVLWVSFAVIVFMAEGNIKLPRLAYSDWYFLPATVPIIITAFHFHNIIPCVCISLKWDMKTIWKAMLIGMIVGYVMNAIWLQVGLSAIPLAGSNISIFHAFKNNLPATVPLSREIGRASFTTISLLFAFLAIATSYLANGKGLLHFIEDLTKNHLNLHNKFMEIVLTFAPPLLISLIYPNIFLKSLNVVGGVGIVLLFGILPSIIAIKNHGKWIKALGVLMFVFFTSFFVLEIMQETGLLDIQPHIEHWRTIYTTR